MKKGKIVAVLGACSASLLFTGCANTIYQPPDFLSGVTQDLHETFASDDPCSHNDRNIGVVAGTLAGAALGNIIKHNRTATLIGAAVGATAGGLVGNHMDSRRCALYKIAKENDLKMASQELTPQQLGTTPSGNTKPDSAVGLDVQFQNRSDEFESGTAQLTPKARRYFSEMAKQYAPGNSKESHKVLIVAHTSQSNGNDVKLTSEQAHAVAEVFREYGVPSRDIYYQGAGDALPIASNASTQGQDANKRIEIVDLPSTTDLKHFLARRQVNPENFQRTNPASSKATKPAEASTAAETTSGSQYSGQSTEQKAPVVAQNTNGPTSTETSESAPHYYQHIQNRYGFNFGGEPLKDAGLETISLGESQSSSTFNFIPTAQAAERVDVTSCLNDRPREAGAVRNLATGTDLPVRDYMPGFYGAPWLGGFNGNLVVIEGDYIPRDSGSPVPHPKFIVYPNYKGDAKARPGYDHHIQVNVYRGSKATLYRMFVNGPAQCVDLIKPVDATMADVKVYYEKQGTQYVATGQMAVKN